MVVRRRRAHFERQGRARALVVGHRADARRCQILQHQRAALQIERADIRDLASVAERAAAHIHVDDIRRAAADDVAGDLAAADVHGIGVARKMDRAAARRIAAGDETAGLIDRVRAIRPTYRCPSVVPSIRPLLVIVALRC